VTNGREFEQLQEKLKQKSKQKPKDLDGMKKEKENISRIRSSKKTPKHFTEEVHEEYRGQRTKVYGGSRA
jgi:phage terminase small subunit